MSCIPTNPQKEILARGGIKSRLRHDTQNACQQQSFNGPASPPLQRCNTLIARKIGLGRIGHPTKNGSSSLIPRLSCRRESQIGRLGVSTKKVDQHEPEAHCPAKLFVPFRQQGKSQLIARRPKRACQTVEPGPDAGTARLRVPCDKAERESERERDRERSRVANRSLDAGGWCEKA